MPNYRKKDTYRKYNQQSKKPYLKHHLIKSNHILFVKKLTAKELQHKTTSSTSHKYFKNMFLRFDFGMNRYTLSRIATIDPTLRRF